VLGFKIETKPTDNLRRKDFKLMDEGAEEDLDFQ